MGLDAVTPPAPPQPKGKPEATGQGNGGGNGGGMLSKLEDGFFEGKGVSNIALRIAHDIPPDPDDRLEAPEGASERYLELLLQYQGPDPVAQVDTLTVGGDIEEDDVFEITLDPEGTPAIVTYTAEEGATIESVVAGLVTAWNGAFLGITAAGASPNITLTADTPGEPFIVTLATPINADGDEDVPTFVNTTPTPSVEATDVIIEEEPEPDPDIVPLDVVA